MGGCCGSDMVFSRTAVRGEQGGIKAMYTGRKMRMVQIC